MSSVFTLLTHVSNHVTIKASPPPRWFPPEQQFYKVNFGGAIFKNIDAVGLGVVICDNNGEVMGAMSQRVPLPQTVVEVEALACLRAVFFAIELGLCDLVIEGDSALVIQAIKDGQPCQSFYGHIVDGILHLTAQLRCFTFCHVKCNCNRIADALAKKSGVGLDFQVWVKDLLELPCWMFVEFYFCSIKAPVWHSVWFLQKKKKKFQFLSFRILQPAKDALTRKMIYATAHRDFGQFSDTIQNPHPMVATTILEFEF